MQIFFLFEIHEEHAQIFYIVLHCVGESGHCGAVDDSMIGRPADLHHANWHHIVVVVEARQFLNRDRNYRKTLFGENKEHFKN